MRRRLVAIAAVLALAAAACTDGGGEEPRSTASPTAGPRRGGTLRLAVVGDTNNDLDPQQSWTSLQWELLRCCLVRTLFSYNGRPAAEGGAEARPDLAADAPEVSADGLTWTIRIRPDIHYAPPLEDVEVTARDFVRGLMREAFPPTSRWGFPFYYSIIEGFDAYASGDADTISGLEAPDEHTLVIRLTEPAGDLPDRLALPATAPIPPNPHRPEAVFGAAQGHTGSSRQCMRGHRNVACGYGHFLIASGPYMIEGSEDLDLSLPPSEQEPIAGFSPTRYVIQEGELPRVVAPGSLMLVRNPSWDPATDDLRAAYADRIEIELRGAWSFLDAAVNRAAERELSAAVEAGTVDHVPDLTSTPVQIRRYRTDPAMEGRVTTLPTEAVSYVVMKLAVPPFDDVHVRRAVAFAIDRAEILEVLASDPQVASWFGTAQPVAATHIAPDALEGNLLATYEPYPPNLSRARQEMAQSSYDTDGDGRCDAPECREVLALAREDSFGSDASDAVAARLAAIGIGVRVEMASATRFYRRLNSEAEKGALGFGADFAAEYPNASTFLPPMFSSAFIGSWNWSLVGATSAQLTRAGYEVTSVPSVDERLDRCATMTGLAQTECWADLDRYLMEQVVPFVPYLTTTETFVVSERVSSSSYSVLSRGLALDRIALEEGSE